MKINIFILIRIKVLIFIEITRRNYITSALFYFDLVATIPIELIIHNIPYIETESIIWMQSLRLTRLCRLPTTIIYMNNAADVSSII